MMSAMLRRKVLAQVAIVSIELSILLAGPSSTSRAAMTVPGTLTTNQSLTLTVALRSSSETTLQPTASLCMYAEDGRCIPAPLPASQKPATSQGQRQSVPQGPAVLVKHKASVQAGAFIGDLHAWGFAQAEGLLVPRWWRVPVPAGQTVRQVITRLQSLPGVEVVEEDKQVTALFTPNDPYFWLQWGPQNVQAPAAWDLTQGSVNVWVAIVDTGIDYNHPDRPAFLLLGYNFAYNNSDPYDDYSHGTHVAGIAAANTNNGIGVAGLCPYCMVLAVKVFDSSGSGANSTVANGIEYAAYWGSYYGEKTIINLSLGSPFYSQVLADAVSYAQSLGDLVVAAAGNAGPGPSDYPAALPGVVAVSATDSDNQPAYFSQYGDVAAPGVSIYSTVPLWYASTPYTYFEGTSMASPHIAGGAGLVWSVFPSCSAGQVASELEMTADAPLGWNYNYGWGRLNVNNALLRFTTNTLPIATTGSWYSAGLNTVGGAGGKTFSVSSGSLPPGLALSYPGTIAGTPTQAGVYSFTVHVADGFCETADQTYTLSVHLQVFLPLVSTK